MFGTIMDIRIKGKNAVVLYSQVSEAQRCTSSWADTNLANQTLGWKATRNLQDMCRDAWRWQKNSQPGLI